MNNSNDKSKAKLQAIVVGITHYKHDDYNDLKLPRENAEKIAKKLEENFYVTPLKKRTRKYLKDKIDELFNPGGKSNPDNIALLYFSGYVIEQQTGIKEVFLATSDCNPNKDYELGVSLLWLAQVLKQSPINHQIIIIDCYYTGNEENKVKLENIITGYQNDKSRLIIISFNKKDLSLMQYSPNFILKKIKT
mgnify:CR=1 FL=1